MTNNNLEDKILPLEEAIKKSLPRREYFLNQITIPVNMDEYLGVYAQLLNDPLKVRDYIELLSPESKQGFYSEGVDYHSREMARKAGRIKKYTSKETKMVEGDEWMFISFDGEIEFERGKPTAKEINKSWILGLFGLNYPMLSWDVGGHRGSKDCEQNAWTALNYLHNEVLPQLYEKADSTSKVYNLKGARCEDKKESLLRVSTPILFASERPMSVSWNVQIPTQNNKKDKQIFDSIRNTVDLMKKCPVVERLSIYQRVPACLIPTWRLP